MEYKIAHAVMSINFFNYMYDVYSSKFNTIAHDEKLIGAMGFIGKDKYTPLMSMLNSKMELVKLAIDKTYKKYNISTKDGHKIKKDFCKNYPNTHTIYFAKIDRLIRSSKPYDDMLVSFEDYINKYQEVIRLVFDDNSIEVKVY